MAVLSVRPVCVPEVALTGRAWSPSRHHSDRVARRVRVLKLASWIAAAVTASFGALQLTLGGALWWLGVANVACALVFLVIPKLCPYG